MKQADSREVGSSTWSTAVLCIVLVSTYCVASWAVSFEDVDFEYISAQAFIATELSLSDLELGETVLLKTPAGHFSKLHIGYTTSYSAGSKVYSVEIMEGVTYSPSGDVVVTFADVLLQPGEPFSVLTGSSSTEGHILLEAEVGTYDVTRIRYYLRTQGGSRLARCLESRRDVTITVGLIGSHYSARLLVDGQYETSLYRTTERTVRLDPGHHTLRAVAEGYKDWTIDLTLSAGEQRQFTVELAEIVSAAFTWEPSYPEPNDPIAFDVSESTGDIVSYEWDWDGDGRFDETTANPEITHSFAVGKYHLVALRVTDEEGDTDVVANAILVYAAAGQLPVVHVTFSVESGEDPFTVHFDVGESYDPDGSIETYYWDFGDGEQSETPGESTTISHTYQTPGTYTASVEATDDDGLSATGSVTVDIEKTNDPPVASFTWEVMSPEGTRLLVEPRTGDRIRFDASESRDPDGRIVKYDWDWDSDGTYDLSTTDSLTEHQFSSPGSRRVTLRVIDGRGAATQTTQTVAIGDRQPPVAGFTFSPISPSILDTVGFTDQSADPDGSVTSWHWEFGDGETTTDRHPTHHYTRKDDFAVTLTVTDSDGLTAASTQTVTMRNLLPDASFAVTPTEPVVGRPTSFDASMSQDPDGEISSHAWDFTGDAATDVEGAKQTWSFSFGDKVTVSLTVTDNDGATRTAQQTLSPNHPPVVSFAWQTLSPEGARLLVEPRTSDRIRFDASESRDPDGQIIKYEWDWESDGTYDESTTDSATEYRFTQPGSHRVTLRATDDSGTASEVAKTVDVHEKQPPEAGFNVTPIQPSLLDEISFIDTSIDDDGRVVAWQWDFGDGSTSNTQHPIHRYRAKGTFEVSLTVTDDDGQTGTAVHELTIVNLHPEPAFVFLPNAVRPGRDVQFDASGSSDSDGEVVEYEWDFDGDGEIDATGTPAEWTYTEPGTYTVALTVTDNEGATATAKQVVTVEAAVEIIEPAEVWALVIGISNYREVKNLEYARADAEGFTRWLLDVGVDPDHIVLLLDESVEWSHLEGIRSELATLTKARAALDWLRRMARPDDLVFVFFAGHGYQGEDDDGDEADGVDEFLVLYDAEKSALEATSLRDDEFGRFLDRVESDHVMVVFDSCHSGGQSRSLSSGARPIGDKFDIFNDFSLEGKLVLAAAKEEQEALEHHRLGHGVFTHFLLRGLKGEGDLDLDYRITADELFAYVRTEVEQFAREERGRTQTPEMTGRGSVGIVLSRTNRPPEASFTVQPGIPYACGRTTFGDRSTDDAGIISWQWDFGDGETSQEQTPVHVYKDEGVYTIVLTVIDAASASSTVQEQITIAPPAEVTVIAGGTIIISLGSINGVKPGNRFEVIRILQLSDGTTITERKGVVEVIEILDVDRSACHVLEEAYPIVRHDRLRPLDGST